MPQECYIFSLLAMQQLFWLINVSKYFPWKIIILIPRYKETDLVGSEKRKKKDPLSPSSMTALCWVCWVCCLNVFNGQCMVIQLSQILHTIIIWIFFFFIVNFLLRFEFTIYTCMANDISDFKTQNRFYEPMSALICESLVGFLPNLLSSSSLLTQFTVVHMIIVIFRREWSQSVKFHWFAYEYIMRLFSVGEHWTACTLSLQPTIFYFVNSSHNIHIRRRMMSILEFTTRRCVIVVA